MVTPQVICLQQVFFITTSDKHLVKKEIEWTRPCLSVFTLRSHFQLQTNFRKIPVQDRNQRYDGSTETITNTKFPFPSISQIPTDGDTINKFKFNMPK